MSLGSVASLSLSSSMVSSPFGAGRVRLGSFAQERAPGAPRDARLRSRRGIPFRGNREGRSRSPPPRGRPGLEARQRGPARTSRDERAPVEKEQRDAGDNADAAPVYAGEGALAQSPTPLSGAGRTTSRPLPSRVIATDCPCRARSAGVARKTTKRAPSDTTQ